MQSVPILRASPRTASSESRQLTSIDGQPIAQVYEAPGLLMARIVAEARKVESQPRSVRNELLARAGRLFAEATLEGQAPGDYCRDAAALSGLPVGVFQRALAHYRSASVRSA